MKIKRFLLAFALFLIIHDTTSFSNNSVHAHQKRMVADPYRSFSDNINKCLFDAWVINTVLSNQVLCTSQQLCYGKHNEGQALFAVCYNTNTLIPEFTGNIVQSGGTKGEEDMIDPPELYDDKWKTDQGLVLANTPVARDADYAADQTGKFDNYNNMLNQFLARGHLTPNGDFSKDFGENSFTYVTTNIAPQWQPFNMGNWAVIETAVKNYAKQKGRTLYVFTGTGGKAKYNGGDILLKDRVLTPKYYWKAVCDPAAGTRQSVIFVAENRPGDISNDNVLGCNGKQQTGKLGVVYCYSWQGAAAVPNYADFKLPPFSDVNCQPDVKGTFLDTFINKLQ